MFLERGHQQIVTHNFERVVHLVLHERNQERIQEQVVDATVPHTSNNAKAIQHRACVSGAWFGRNLRAVCRHASASHVNRDGRIAAPRAHPRSKRTGCDVTVPHEALQLVLQERSLE